MLTRKTSKAREHTLSTRHWIRVGILLLAALLLGRLANSPKLTGKSHALPLVGWTTQIEDGALSSLVAFPGGGCLWVYPDSLAMQRFTSMGSHCQGNALVIIADTLGTSLLSSLASTVDSGGTIVVRGHIADSISWLSTAFTTTRGVRWVWSNPSLDDGSPVPGTGLKLRYGASGTLASITYGAIVIRLGDTTAVPIQSPLEPSLWIPRRGKLHSPQGNLSLSDSIGATFYTSPDFKELIVQAQRMRSFRTP